MITNSKGSESGDDEDDYLTMTFEEPEVHLKKETLTQKKKRLAREAEQRGRPKSKAQLAEEERMKREAALNRSDLDPSNKGFKMMAALGYKPGSALGKELTDTSITASPRLLEPIGLDMKEDRSGIGADTEKKRKFREEVAKQQDSEKRQKVDAEEFRIRQQQEREEKRHEGQFVAAMKVAERLEEEDLATDEAQPFQKHKPLHSYNILWRGLIKQRLLAERDRRMRHDLDKSLSRQPTYSDPYEDENDRIALSGRDKVIEADTELDQDDQELDDFENLPPTEKLEKIITHLRQHWHYCFWCKYRYSDSAMDGCPGISEEEHD